VQAAEAVELGVCDEFGAARAIELELDARAMGLDGAYAQVESLGDLSIGVAFGEQLEHVDFARTEPAGRVGRLRDSDELNREVGVEVATAGGDRTNRLHELLQWAVLELVARRARGERRARPGRIRIRGQDEDRCLRCGVTGALALRN
jgi:hypothetical protein